MESMDIVRLEYWNENTGQFPVNPWKMSMEFFQYVHGIFPVCPWNFSMESMEFFHGIHGLFPWTMSMEFVQVHCGQNPWTMSMEYFHGHCPLIYSRWLCSVNPEKTFESYCFHSCTLWQDASLVNTNSISC